MVVDVVLAAAAAVAAAAAAVAGDESGRASAVPLRALRSRIPRISWPIGDDRLLYAVGSSRDRGISSCICRI